MLLVFAFQRVDRNLGLDDAQWHDDVGSNYWEPRAANKNREAPARFVAP